MLETRLLWGEVTVRIMYVHLLPGGTVLSGSALSTHQPFKSSWCTLTPPQTRSTENHRSCMKQADLQRLPAVLSMPEPIISEQTAQNAADTLIPHFTAYLDWSQRAACCLIKAIRGVRLSPPGNGFAKS